jgi:hypothetical protein
MKFIISSLLLHILNVFGNYQYLPSRFRQSIYIEDQRRSMAIVYMGSRIVCGKDSTIDIARKKIHKSKKNAYGCKCRSEYI